MIELDLSFIHAVIVEFVIRIIALVLRQNMSAQRRVSGVIVDLIFSRAVPARKIAAIVCGVLAVMLTENVTLMCVDAAELQHVTVMEDVLTWTSPWEGE